MGSSMGLTWAGQGIRYFLNLFGIFHVHYIMFITYVHYVATCSTNFSKKKNTKKNAKGCSRRSLESAWVSVFPNISDPDPVTLKGKAEKILRNSFSERLK